MNKKHPNRLRRNESFLGLHFDMHANVECNQIGKDVTPKMVEEIIRQVGPDYIHCDCKGVFGFSSYPTKVGHPAPGFVRDPLRVWRDVTAKRGVALYVHFCAIFSQQSVKKHPSWARVNADGKRDTKCVSLFGPYLDKEFIPQLKEIVDKYGVDGVWVDGDCCWIAREYDKKVLDLFRKKTGIKTVPRKPSDPYYYELAQFCRDRYREHLKHYIDELHKHDPDFQICCALAYSSGMPEPVATDMDFISGDTPSLDSLNAARIESRALVHQGKPWDVVMWGFTYVPDGGVKVNTKPAVQMQQEAAIMLALGGGVTVYFYQQKRDASVTMNQMKPMAELAKFCRQRQEYCHKATPIPQIALLHSTASYYHTNPALFNVLDADDLTKPSFLMPIRGILQNLLESQNVVDVVMEHHLADMGKYPLIIVPESEYLDGKFKRQLLAYVKSGGSLLIIGYIAAKAFKKELGVKYLGEPKKKIVWLGYGDTLGSIDSYQAVKLTKGKEFGRFYQENDTVGVSTPAASVVRLGKGKIAAVYANIGELYTKAANPTIRKFLAELVRELFPDPMVTVTGSQYVDVTLNRLGDKIMINLVNTAGPHADSKVHGFDEIPAIGPLEMVVKVKSKPRKVAIEPEHVAANYVYKSGKVIVKLPQLSIHNVVVIE